MDMSEHVMEEKSDGGSREAGGEAPVAERAHGPKPEGGIPGQPVVKVGQALPEVLSQEAGGCEATLGRSESVPPGELLGIGVGTQARHAFADD